MDYRARRVSHIHWTVASKLFSAPVDGMHLCVQIPARAFVEEVIVEKTVGYGMGNTGNESVTIGFIGNAGAANDDAFLTSAGITPMFKGVISSKHGTAFNAGGKYFKSPGMVTVTSFCDGGNPGTFQVYVRYTQLTN